MYQPLPGGVEAADSHARDQPEKTIAHFTRNGLTPNSDSMWPQLSVEGGLSLDTPSTDDPVGENPRKRRSAPLNYRVYKRLEAVGTSLFPRPRSSPSDYTDEQNAKEQKISNQLTTFSQGIETLQESLNTLSLTQERSHTALQTRYDALEHKIDEIAHNEQQYAQSFNKSLGHHYNQVDVLIKSYLDMLPASHQHPLRKLRDSQGKLEEKIDTVLRNDDELARHLTDCISQHHDRINKTLDTNLERLFTSHQQSHTMLHQGHVVLQKKIDEVLSDNPEKLKTKIDTVLRDGELVRRLTDSFSKHHDRIDMTLRTHLKSLSTSHVDSHTMLYPAGLMKKIDKFLSDDHDKLRTKTKVDTVPRDDGELIRHLTDSFSKHHNRIDMTLTTHLDSLSTKYLDSYNMLHQDHVGLKKRIEKFLNDDHEELKTNVDTLRRNDQGIASTLTKRFDDHHSQYDAALQHRFDDLRSQIDIAFQRHFNNLSTTDQHTKMPIRAGYTRLNEKLDAILRDDQTMIKEKIEAALRNDNVGLAQKIDAVLREDQRITQTLTDGFAKHHKQISKLAQSCYAHEETRKKEYTIIEEDFISFETLIRDFCIQIQVAQPGDEAVKALRRKRVDQVYRSRPRPYILRV